MNVQDVITRVRRKFGDDAAVQITDDDIIRWINDAQVEIVKNNDQALQKTAFLNLVAGTSQYTVPADLMVLRSLRYKYAGMASYSALRYKNMQQFDEEVDGWDGTFYPNMNPRFFTRYESSVILFPTPDESNTNGLKVLYNQQPVAVTGLLDSLPLPILYHNTVEKYCMWQASLLDEDHEPALMYKTDFQSDIGILINNETRDPVATYSIITVLQDDL